MRNTLIILIIILTLASSSIACHDISHPCPESLTLDEFELGSQDPAAFRQLSQEDQQQYLRNQVEAGAQIHNDPQLSQMAGNYVQEEFFDPEVDSSDFEIGENLFNNQDVNKNAETVNKAPKGFQKIRRAKGNKKFVMKGKVKTYDSSTSTLSTDKQEIKLDSFTDDSYGVIITENDQITFIDQFDEEHNFEGSLDAFSKNPFVGKLLLIKKGSIDGHPVTEVAFRITKDGISGSATEFDSIKFPHSTDFFYEKSSGKTILYDGTQVDSVQNAKIAGENIIFSNGDVILNGVVTYKDERANQVLGGAKLDAITHITGQEPLELRYATNDEIYNLNQQEAKELAAVDQQRSSEFGTKDEAIAHLDKLNNDLQRLKSDARYLRDEQQELATLIRSGKANQVEKDRYHQLPSLINTKDQGIAVANNVFDAAANIIVPSELKREEIITNYRQKRNALFDQMLPDIKPSGNYFIYGKGRLWAGGEGFTSSLEDNNEIFPEFVVDFSGWKTQKRLGLLRVTPLNGEIDMRKVSADDAPLAIEAVVKGNVQIDNGRFQLQSDGNNILSKTVEEHNSYPDARALVSSDMRLNYDNNGEVKVYDLNVDNAYFAKLNDDEKYEIKNQIQLLDVEINKFRDELNVYKNNPQHKEEISQFTLQLAQLRKEELGIFDSLNHWRGQLRRANQYPDSNAAEQSARLERINKNINKFSTEQKENWRKTEEINKNPVMIKLSQAGNEISKRENKRRSLDYKLTSNRGIQKTGAFGQILQPTEGGTTISYQEYIHGFPIKKNTDAFRYEEERYDPKTGFTKGYKRLETPLVYERNTDKLNLDVITYQECIDTQFRLAYEYALQTGQNICYDNGKTCMSHYSNKRQFLNKWMGERGTRTYEKATEKQEIKPSHWAKDIEVIHPDDYDAIQPGDVLLTGGHAIGVKEVILIDGEKYIRKFAGSMPAIDAHVYKDLVKVSELQKGMGLKSIYRWKFRGKAKSIDQLDHLYQLSTQK